MLTIACVLLGALGVALFMVLRSRTHQLTALQQTHSTTNIEHAQLQERYANLERKLHDEQQRFESQQLQLREAFETLSNKTLDRALDQFQKFARESLGTHTTQAKADLEQRKTAVAHLVKPIEDSLKQTKEYLSALETKRESAYGSLKQQIESMSLENVRLRSETSKLVNALGKPQVRGRYGEIQLQRIAEIAGMREYCDFDTQSTHHDDAGTRYRPDMIVRLPNERIIIIDAKTNTESYMHAIQTDDPQLAEQHLKTFAKHVLDEAKRLSNRGYVDVVKGRSPDFVVMFIPADQLVDAALEREHSLLDTAASNGVIIASPSTLIGLLRAVHIGWGEKQLSDQANELFELGRELHERASVALEKAVKVGDAIERAGRCYDEFVGSVDARLMPTLKKFAETGAKSSKDLPALPPAKVNVRPMQSIPKTDPNP
jgi:DNA recombination protein RmuC